MTREFKIGLLEDRINKLQNNGKNIKSEGVLRKCQRKLRKLREAE